MATFLCEPLVILDFVDTRCGMGHTVRSRRLAVCVAEGILPVYAADWN